MAKDQRRVHRRKVRTVAVMIALKSCPIGVNQEGAESKKG